MNTFQKIKYSIKKKRYEHKYSRRSFSQEGEDLLVQYILNGRENGFYVDVGAHHPLRFSNTHSFYLRGWRGINIDARPGGMDIFDLYRPRDINLELGIADREDTMTYYVFNDPALNGFSADLSNLREEASPYRIIDRKEIRTYPLATVLDRHLPPGTSIDFMSVDVEGLDYEVLVSNNWARYRPEVLIVEELSTSLETISQGKIARYLHDQGYCVKSKLINSVIFTRK